VFGKAGTKKLPIVYIDDVYVGDSERIFELEASGELDRLLKFNERGGRTGVKPAVKSMQECHSECVLTLFQSVRRNKELLWTLWSKTKLFECKILQLMWTIS
jgi:hypothetical protein